LVYIYSVSENISERSRPYVLPIIEASYSRLFIGIHFFVTVETQRQKNVSVKAAHMPVSLSRFIVSVCNAIYVVIDFPRCSSPDPASESLPIPQDRSALIAVGNLETFTADSFQYDSTP
jgi:hypothetical protein